jgi:hypothetical protein
MDKNQDIENFFDDEEVSEQDNPNNQQPENASKEKTKDEDKGKTKDENKVELLEEDGEEADAPIFEKKKKDKPDKEESISILRKQRDELQEKVKAYEDTGININSLKPILDYVSESADGVLDEDTAKIIVQEIKSKDEEIASLKETLQDKDKKIAEIDIRYSDDFKTKYQEPYVQASESLLLEFASITPEKKIIAPKATKALHDSLMDKAEELTAIDVKAMLSQYAKDFEEESGETASIPTINSLMKSLRDFSTARGSMKNAYENWSSIRKQESDKSIAEKEKESEAVQKQKKRERSKLFSKAFQEFDLDALDFIDEDAAKETFNEEYKFIEKIIADPDKAPGHDELITRGVKSRLWDKHLDNYKRLLALEKEISKGRKRNDGTANVNNINKDDDWLD